MQQGEGLGGSGQKRERGEGVALSRGIGAARTRKNWGNNRYIPNQQVVGGRLKKGVSEEKRSRCFTRQRIAAFVEEERMQKPKVGVRTPANYHPTTTKGEKYKGGCH